MWTQHENGDLVVVETFGHLDQMQASAEEVARVFRAEGEYKSVRIVERRNNVNGVQIERRYVVAVKKTADVFKPCAECPFPATCSTPPMGCHAGPNADTFPDPGPDCAGVGAEAVDVDRYLRRGIHGLTPGRSLAINERRIVERIVTHVFGVRAADLGVGYQAAEAAYRLFAPEYPTEQQTHDASRLRATALLMLVGRAHSAWLRDRPWYSFRPPYSHGLPDHIAIHAGRLVCEWSARGWYLG